MAETKHTPGPWKWERPEDGHPCDYRYLRANRISVLVAERAHNMLMEEADARLIAAAPAQAIIIDLVRLGLGRFERFEFCFGGLRYCHREDWPGLVDAIGWDNAHAAIAKAKES